MSTIKYQVFISSTYEDLKEERDEVIKAVLEMGHIPVGMEMFSAADEEQWKLITRQIDQTDYYVVIVAHRYGSVIGKKSYTEKEYEYAVKQKIPVLGFIIEDSARWPNDRIESDSDKTKALKLFKQKIKRKLISFWSTKEDLGGKVSRSLIKLITTNPRPGWVRTSETVGPEVVSEMSRLSSENARLDGENKQLKKDLAEKIKGESSHLAQGEELVDIGFWFSVDKTGKLKEKGNIQISWNELFLEVGEELLKSTIESSIEKKINQMISNKKNLINLPMSIDIGFYPNVDEEELLKIKIQFIALGYIDVEVIASTREDSIFERALYVQTQLPHWTLTLLGKRKLTELLAIRRESIA